MRSRHRPSLASSCRLFESCNTAAGILAGTHSTIEQPGNGLAFVLINIEAFLPAADYAALAVEMRDYLKSSSLAVGHSEILLPGEADFQKKQFRLQKGIPLDERTWEEIRTAAAALGVGTLATKA